MKRKKLYYHYFKGGEVVRIDDTPPRINPLSMESLINHIWLWVPIWRYRGQVVYWCAPWMLFGIRFNKEHLVVMNWPTASEKTQGQMFGLTPFGVCWTYKQMMNRFAAKNQINQSFSKER